MNAKTIDENKFELLKCVNILRKVDGKKQKASFCVKSLQLAFNSINHSLTSCYEFVEKELLLHAWSIAQSS